MDSESIDLMPMPRHSWAETSHRLDICCATKRLHMEIYQQKLLELAFFPVFILNKTQPSKAPERLSGQVCTRHMDLLRKSVFGSTILFASITIPNMKEA